MTMVALKSLTPLIAAAALPISIASRHGSRTPQVRHKSLKAFRGSTPHIDGVLSPGEWSDAFAFVTPFRAGLMDWTPEFKNVTDPSDLSMRGWIKHDHEALYIAVNVTDDILYRDGKLWTPPGNPSANVLNQTGWPWFGDEMEVLLNAAHNAGDGSCRGVSDPKREVVGNETEWQLVMNIGKSRLGGIGVGGLLEGEPRSNLSAWNNYQRWIKTGLVKGATNVAFRSPGLNVWVAEWHIDFTLMQIEPGKPYSADMPDTAMGINIALKQVKFK